MKKYTVAVVGATGAVGAEMLKILEERDFPVAKLKALAGNVSKHREVMFNGESIVVEEAKAGAFKDVDIALFAVGAEVSEYLAPIAVSESCIVIDNSSRWRTDPDVPLVVPEVNPQALKKHHGIIANPNCSTIIAMMPVKPLNDYANIKRMIVSTYQAVSGAGIKGIGELRDQSLQVLNGEEIHPSAFAHQIAFNLIPHIDYFEDNDYTHEEMKMLREGRKILGTDININCTCVRVPVFRSHSESITIETEKEITPEKARELLAAMPGVKVVDDPENNVYPMPADTSDQNLVFVGRIRKDISTDGNGLTFWCAGDQIRKGAALNAVQIAEKMVEMELC